MKLWPFGKRKTQEQAGVMVPSPYTVPDIVPFPDEVYDVPGMKLHGLRALCGAMMDRHDSCRSPHPFCGTHWYREDIVGEIIVHVQQQHNPEYGSILGIYLCRATRPDALAETPAADRLDYARSLIYMDKVPIMKMAVFLVSDGTYLAKYGYIANPVEGEYSTGALDPFDVRTFNCNPEPTHAKWEYWDSDLSEGQVAIPSFGAYTPLENGRF